MMKLHGYWRSSTSYRVRIALALKGVEVEHVAVNLREGEQGCAEHKSRNPQAFVPVLELEDGTELTQSLAIMDYLDATFREPALMPRDPILRSKILSASLIIASDVSPIQNLSVLKYLRAEYGQGDEGVTQWVHHWITRGFDALETVAKTSDTTFLFTETPMFFECCLIPQIYNARRYGVEMTAYPRLSAIETRCQALPPFEQARPETQHDAPQA
jgi:maleylacetoacetate isomerase